MSLALVIVVTNTTGVALKAQTDQVWPFDPLLQGVTAEWWRRAPRVGAG